MAYFTRKRVVRIMLFLVLAAIVGFGYANRDYIRPLGIAAGFKARILCTGVFVSGRTPESVLSEDIAFDSRFGMLKPKIDYEKKTVSASLFGTGLFKNAAIYNEQLGAILLSGVSEETGRGWKPNIPGLEPQNPETVAWPSGDLASNEPLPESVNISTLDAAVDKVFSEPDPSHRIRTRAVLVVCDGRIVAERYATGFTKDTRLISWSMAKSVTNALIGILAREGKIDIRQPAPVPEWSAPDDPRHAITVEHLLWMSPGLEWFEAYEDRPYSDVNLMLFTKPDMAAYAAAKPLIAPPGQKMEYSTGTTMILSRIIRQAAGNLEDYWAFPRRELFNKIGMRSAMFNTDASGTFLTGSDLFATARDYARFGLLYLNDGVWQGERILPEGWVAFSTTPAPSAKKGDYGAQFWLNKGDPAAPQNRMYPRLPQDIYLAEGYQGQMIAVIPSRKIVVVRLGMTYDDKWGLEEFLEEVLKAIQ